MFGRNIISSLLNKFRSTFRKRSPAIFNNQANTTCNTNAQAGPPPAADMFMPSQGFTHTINIDEAPCDGAVESRSETWSRQGNTLRCDTNTRLYETCSGLLVDASALKAKCKVTGKPAEAYERCFRCGWTICLRHCRGLSTPDGVFYYCEKCLKKELKQWSTWVEVDGQLVVRLPPKPFCPASASSVHGSVSHESNEAGGGLNE